MSVAIKAPPQDPWTGGGPEPGAVSAAPPLHQFLCLHPSCQLPVARIGRGHLIIESRHHGERHVNSISYGELLHAISLDPFFTRFEVREVTLLLE